jgi:hypothetical protein
MKSRITATAALGTALFAFGCTDAEKPDSPLAPNAPAHVSAAASVNEAPRAVVTFRRTLPDAEVIQILQRYGLKAVELHMTAGGMFGSHERFTPDDPQTAVETARSSTRSGTQKAVHGSAVRFQRFRQEHPRAVVLGNPQLEEQTRSLVEVRARLGAVLNAAKANQPLIYAVEASGSSEELSALAKDTRVEHFVAVANVNGRLVAPAPASPVQVIVPRGIAELKRRNEGRIYDHVDAYAAGDVGTLCVECIPTEPEPEPVEPEPGDTTVAPGDPLYYYDGGGGPRSTYWPNEGDYWFNGAYFADSYFLLAPERRLAIDHTGIRAQSEPRIHLRLGMYRMDQPALSVQ